MSATLPVHFKFHSPPSGERVEVGDTLQAMRRVLAHGFQHLQLIGLPSGAQSLAVRTQSGFHLFVEEDVDFMLQHYEQIESVFADGSHQDLYLFLGDGALQLNTRFVADVAKIEVISCPGLRKSWMNTEWISTSRQSFLMAWRQVARDLTVIAPLGA